MWIERHGPMYTCGACHGRIRGHGNLGSARIGGIAQLTHVSSAEQHMRGHADRMGGQRPCACARFLNSACAFP